MADVVESGRLVRARPEGRLAQAPLEIFTADDRLVDYVLHPYAPAAPAVGKLLSVNLLLESFALLGVEAEGRAVIEAVRAGLGRDRTVWGIKERGGEVAGWELYFYDYERAHAELSIARIAQLLGGLVTVDAVEPYPLPWHMFSIEFNRDQLRARARVPAHVYIDMRSYELSGARFTFENIYTFHDAGREIDDVLHRLQSSVHFDARHQEVARLLAPHLVRCHRICVANKQKTDAVYFSRIDTPALATFLAERGWPAALARFVSANATELDHLLWDVGMDFDGADQTLHIRKTGLYGSF